MKEFKSYRSFIDFCRHVIQKNRYIRSPEGEEFLQTVLATSESRKKRISAGKIFCRAQLGCRMESYYEENVHVDNIPAPFCAERMKPKPEKALEGRINPKGIPCLYLSADYLILLT